MFGSEVILILILIRVILPIGFALWIGEWVRRQEKQYWSR